MPSNTLSRRIRHLEEELGIRLLQRTTRKLSLTGPGRRFYDSCAEPMAAIDTARGIAAGDSNVPRGVLRITAPGDFFFAFQLDWVQDFLSRHDQVSLEFVLSDTVLDMVAERIDVAIRSGDLPNSSMASRRLGPSYSVFVASPAYLEARGRPRGLDELEAHQCLAFPRQQERAEWVVHGPNGRETVPVSGRFSANTMHALHQAAVAGLGIALVPLVRVAADIRNGKLEIVLPAYRREVEGLFALLPSRRQQSAAVTKFVEFVALRQAALTSEIESLPGHGAGSRSRRPSQPTATAKEPSTTKKSAGGKPLGRSTPKVD